MDIISIQQIRLETTIGIHDWEQAIQQTILIDLDIAIDAAAIATTDNISDTVDYDQIVAAMADFVATERVQLIETLAEKLAQLLLQQFAIRWLKLRLSKPGAIAQANNVSVQIERGQAD